jgi:alpha-mannosidase
LDNRRLSAKRISVREASADRLVIAVEGEFSIYWPLFREFRQYGIKIPYEQTITFHADTPRIDFRLGTHHESGRWYRLRAAFFTDIRRGRIVHEIPFGAFEREEGEFAAQNYMAYYNQRKGVALFNRGLPGNNVTDGVMMLSLMRSVSIYSRTRTEASLEQGARHVFDYAILPFGGKRELDSLSLAREGMEFAMPPYVFEMNSDIPTTPSIPRARESDSLLSIAPDSICCTAIYPEREETIVRLFESRGRATAGVLRVNFDIAGAEETDALLKKRRKLAFGKRRVALEFRPFEIKTVVLRNSSGE